MADEVTLVSDETTLREKIVGFFKSTLGKILVFTGLFLGISWYIITSSNAVLFKGSIIQTGVTDPATQNTSQSTIGTQESALTESNTAIDPSILGLNLTATPNAPTALTAICSEDATSLTLRWMPVTNVTPVTYDLYIQKADMKPGDVLPFMKKDLTTTLFTDFQPTRGQEYQWWLYAKAGSLMSEQAAGTNITCGALDTSSTLKTGIDPDVFTKIMSSSNTGAATTNQGNGTTTLCPPDTYPSAPGVTTNCATLPDFNILKSPAEFTSACQLYKNILSTGLDISMDPNTVQAISKQANGTICSPQFFQGSIGSDPLVATSTSTSTPTTTLSTSTKPQSQQTDAIANTATPSSLETLSQKDTTSPALHPSAGPESASTGPEIWIYSIAAATSYLATRTRRKKEPKVSSPKLRNAFVLKITTLK